jgi:hypothetical protein
MVKLEDCIVQLSLRNDILSLCAADHLKRLQGQAFAENEEIEYQREEINKLKGLLKKHGIDLRNTGFREEPDY